MWVVVKIRLPFGVLSIIRHLVIRGPKRGTVILTTTHVCLVLTEVPGGWASHKSDAGLFSHTVSSSKLCHDWLKSSRLCGVRRVSGLTNVLLAIRRVVAGEGGGRGGWLTPLLHCSCDKLLVNQGLATAKQEVDKLPTNTNVTGLAILELSKSVP